MFIVFLKILETMNKSNLKFQPDTIYRIIGLKPRENGLFLNPSLKAGARQNFPNMDFSPLNNISYPQLNKHNL